MWLLFLHVFSLGGKQAVIYCCNSPDFITCNIPQFTYLCMYVCIYLCIYFCDGHLFFFPDFCYYKYCSHENSYLYMCVRVHSWKKRVWTIVGVYISVHCITSKLFSSVAVYFPIGPTGEFLFLIFIIT